MSARGKAVEGYRSPRRFATEGGLEYSARSWSAPALWRFGRDAEWMKDAKLSKVDGPNARLFSREADLNRNLHPSDHQTTQKSDRIRLNPVIFFPTRASVNSRF